MSLPELAVGLVAVVAAVASAGRPRPRLVLAAVGGAIGIALAGTPRWQLVPAGLALGLLAALTVLGRSRPDAPRMLPRVTAVVVVLGLLTSAALAWVLPVPDLSLAAGGEPVGSLAFDLVDPSRTSPSGRSAGPRLTPVQAWYPTDDGSGPRVRITDEPDEFAAEAGEFLRLPPFMLTHLGDVRTSARSGALVPDGPLPVVLSIHGWGGFRYAQVPLLEQLAADGFLVLAMDHTDGALASQPVSGGVIPLDPMLLPEDVPPQVYDAASTLLEQTFADDAEFLLEALRSGDTQVPDEVVRAADLDQLVVLGHSTGGGAAELLCATGADCGAMVLYDPWVEPVPADVREDGFAAPTFVALSEGWDGNANDRLLRPMLAATDRSELVVLDGTVHQDATVQSRLSPLTPRLGLAGSVPIPRVDEMILGLTRAWIAETTGAGPGQPTVLDDPPWSEVRAD